MTIMKRGSTFHLRNRVPRSYEGMEERKSIWGSLAHGHRYRHSTEIRIVSKRDVPGVPRHSA